MYLYRYLFDEVFVYIYYKLIIMPVMRPLYNIDFLADLAPRY